MLGDAAGDLAEVVPAVDFTKGRGWDEDGVEGEGEVEEGGKRLIMDMENEARGMVDLAWEAEKAGALMKGVVVDVAKTEGRRREKTKEEDGGDEEGGDGGGEGELKGLWELHEEEMTDVKKAREGKSMKERYFHNIKNFYHPFCPFLPSGGGGF